MKSLNSFADHAPKRDWLVSFFELKEEFFTEHTLGPMMYDMFRRFLRDAGLNEKNHFTDFAELISNIGWETDTALGLCWSILRWRIHRLPGTLIIWISVSFMSEIKLRKCLYHWM